MLRCTYRNGRHAGYGNGAEKFHLSAHRNGLSGRRLFLRPFKESPIVPPKVAGKASGLAREGDNGGSNRSSAQQYAGLPLLKQKLRPPMRLRRTLPGNCLRMGRRWYSFSCHPITTPMNLSPNSPCSTAASPCSAAPPRANWRPTAGTKQRRCLGFGAQDFSVFARPFPDLGNFRVEDGRRICTELRRELARECRRRGQHSFGLLLIDGLCRREDAVCPRSMRRWTIFRWSVDLQATDCGSERPGFSMTASAFRCRHPYSAENVAAVSPVQMR